MPQEARDITIKKQASKYHPLHYLKRMRSWV